MDEQRMITVFCEDRRLTGGTVEEILAWVRAWAAQHGEAGLLYFDDRTGKQVDFNLRAAPEPIRVGPGRPKLGVTSREISLLPRHWEWLEDQPNGASAALRRLVDQARNLPENRAKMAREAAGRFMTAMAGNLPGYEEALRALYAGEPGRFREFLVEWPEDVRTYAERLAGEG